jgi:hypoxanthine phosphoribosyltransferase
MSSERLEGTLRVIIGWEEFGQLAERLVSIIKKNNAKFDFVVGIARGGVPLAMVVADRLKIPIDFINVKSYINEGKRGSVKILTTLLSDAKNKDVLLVDDLVDEGDTMQSLVNYLKKDYDPVRLKTAVLFKKPWSRFSPDYYVGTTDAWVIFPWEHGEFLYHDGHKQD